jgi:hypothetical protein
MRKSKEFTGKYLQYYRIKTSSIPEYVVKAENFMSSKYATISIKVNQLLFRNGDFKRSFRAGKDVTKNDLEIVNSEEVILLREKWLELEEKCCRNGTWEFIEKSFLLNLFDVSYKTLKIQQPFERFGFEFREMEDREFDYWICKKLNEEDLSYYAEH